MIEGKIEFVNLDRKFGFIRSNDGKKIHFKLNVVRKPTRWEDLQPGMEVSFDVEQGDRGPTASVVVVMTAGAVSQLGIEPVRKVDEPHEGTYRFLNPYNFVRLLDEPRPKNHILGSIPPPPHDRFTGMSGSITCTLEAVTPLFVSDSHGTQKVSIDGKDHYTYRFFEYDGQPGIPASTLRGMLRSVYEILTNSCLSIFDGDRILEYRQATQYALKLKAGIVRSLPSGDQHGTIDLCRTAKVGAYYTGKMSNRNLLAGKNWKCGDYVWARVTKGRAARAWQLANAPDEIQETNEKSETVRGYLKITGENIEKKVNEYLYIDPAIHGGLGTVSFSNEVLNEYNVVLDGQITEERISMYQHRKLAIGDLVWVDANGNIAVRIAHVRIPRVQYEKSIDDLINNYPHLRHCQNIQSLCPACRTFGWVHPNPDAKMAYTAFAGRLRLGHAKLEYNPGQYGDILLAILSSPKPTTTQFYLLNSRLEPDPTVNYNTRGGRLRGRKVYRHFGNWFDMTNEQQRQLEQEYRQAVRVGEDGRSDQNRTVKGAFKPGAKFSFKLEFENLQPLELGALLYTLKLEDGLYHRLGYAKPLGFGSVKLAVDKLDIVDWQKRFEIVDENAGWKSKNEKIPILIRDFLGEMRNQNEYGQCYDAMLEELRALLGEPPDKPIHYPRPAEIPDPEGKQFEWFVGNKKRVEKLGKGELPKPIVLPIALEDVEGFPLISKDGH